VWAGSAAAEVIFVMTIAKICTARPSHALSKRVALPPVQMLRKILCSSCATMAMPEENFYRFVVSSAFRDDLSSQSSIPVLKNAQVLLSPAARCWPFPHFHSDGYYYGLPTSYKTG
jgi:hypothetical protein